jgi:hypothetical protein
LSLLPILCPAHRAHIICPSVAHAFHARLVGYVATRQLLAAGTPVRREAGTARQIAHGHSVHSAAAVSSGRPLACACAGIGELRAAGSERGHWADTGVRAGSCVDVDISESGEPLGNCPSAPAGVAPRRCKRKRCHPASFAGRYQCSQANFAGAYCLPGYRAGAVYCAVAVAQAQSLSQVKCINVCVISHIAYCACASRIDKRHASCVMRIAYCLKTRHWPGVP